MNILKVISSANRTSSTSSKYAAKVVDKIQAQHPESKVVVREVTYSDIPYVDEHILGALFSPEKTEEQKKALAYSDALVAEVQEADVLVIAAPMYNFSIPASLKAYFDLVARAGLTFQYSENGPVGLLKDKKVVIVISSGGVEVGSAYDFASTYIKQFWSFLGLTDFEVIAVDGLMMTPEASIQKAEQQVAALSF